jgi:hypothetical protein
MKLVRRCVLFSMIFIPLMVLHGGTVIDAEHPFIAQDFDNSGWGTNFFGGKDETVKINREKNQPVLKAFCVEDTDLHKKGRVLSLEYDVVPANGKVSYSMSFNGLDLSLFDRISLKIKGDSTEGFNGMLKIRIHTWNDSLTYILEGITNYWKEFTVPLTDFQGHVSGFNWEGCEKVSFLFENMAFEKKKGRIYIDDITFLAKPSTSISLDELKIQRYLKPRSRLFAFPADIVKKTDLSADNRTLLKQIAADTWLFFKNVIDTNTFLVMDNITVGKNLDDTKTGDYTNITNIGLQLLAILSACDLGFLPEQDARVMIKRLLVTLKKMQKWKGLLYNYYLTKNGMIANNYVSTVDNGWLAAGLICLRNSFNGEFTRDSNALISAMEFGKLYNSKLGQFHLGFITDRKVLSQYHYGLLNTEPRLTSLIAIGKGDVPESHWFRIERTLRKEWDWQRQIPQGKMKKVRGFEFFGGYYTNSGQRFIPSWGGSMFETLMPLIVLDEKKWAPHSLGKNDEIMARLHIKYAREKNYKYWGFSPCSVPDSRWGGYHEFGIPCLGTKGYETENVITPHAIILALLAVDEKTVMSNLRSLLKDHPDMMGEYGLYDSFDMERNTVTKKYLALDQGMLLIALCNYLNNDSIRKRFENDAIFKKTKGFIAAENIYD